MKNLFDPEKSLFNLPIVRWFFFGAITLAIIVSAIICMHTELPLQPDSEGFNNAAVHFRIPLAIIALGLTFIGIFGANHRSEQTKKQIDRTAEQINLTNHQISLTKSQNNFSNYYKHIEEFEKHSERYSKIQSYEMCNSKINIDFSRKIYGRIFINSRSGDYNTSPEFIEEFSIFTEKIFTQSENLNTRTKSKWEDSLVGIEKTRDDYLKINGFKKVVLYSMISIIGKGPMVMMKGDPRYFINEIFLIIHKIDYILSFSTDYSTPKSVKEFLSIKFDEIPEAIYPQSNYREDELNNFSLRKLTNMAFTESKFELTGTLQ